MSPEQFRALVDLSASLLLFVHFLAYVAISVALYIAWQGLRMARREMPAIAEEVARALLELEGVAYDRAGRVVTPPIRVASAWAGLRAGVRAFMGGTSVPRIPRQGDSPPPL